MKSTSQILLLSLLALLVGGGCAKISLTKPGSTPTTTTNVGSAAPQNQTPAAVDGDWLVTFVSNESPFESNVTFSQQGQALAGKGEDASGPFIIQNGTVDGTKVHFEKKYVSAEMMGKEPVQYDGELEYQDEPDYKGWGMVGHYKAVTADGKQLEDKWVAINLATQAQSQQAAAAPPPPEAGVNSAPTPAPRPLAGVSESPASTDKDGPNISRQYVANYEFNFHPVQSILWLEQHNKQVTGHGYDKGGGEPEEFQVVKAHYEYPNLSMVWKYVKGKHAKDSRELAIRAKVSGDLSIKGETQFGGNWEAKVVH